MTQYTDAVEYQKRKMAVEAWAGKIEYILGQDGYVEKAYHSGLVTREFRDGTFVVISEEKPLTQLLLEAPNNV